MQQLGRNIFAWLLFFSLLLFQELFEDLTPVLMEPIMDEFFELAAQLLEGFMH
jgi:hypothetical protein